MDEQLLNEYINNLANQVNTLTQENILLKTRLSLLEKREQERLAVEEKKEIQTNPAPESSYSQPPEVKPEPQPEKPVVEEPSPEPEPSPRQQVKMTRGPRPKGYNPRVDGPRPLIPDTKSESQQ
jgi:cell division protein FtsN